jgi:hypothetical protein
MLVADISMSSSFDREPLRLVRNDEFLTETLTGCLHIQNKIRGRLGLFVQNAFAER